MHQNIMAMTMDDAGHASEKPSMLSLFIRFAGFFLFWLVLIGAEPKHWAFGIVAACAATGASAVLWPASGGLSPFGVARFALRFLPQSGIAGLDVARRAFSPDPGLHPGLVTHETALPPGMARDGMTAVMSLQPGKLPVGVAEEGALLVHCLDTRQPVAAEMAADEAAYLGMFRKERGHG
jgi:multicomponent Na+:H+ antiporter subunit E